MCNSIGLIFIDGDEGDPALINFPLQSICVNNQTYQTGESVLRLGYHGFQESDKNAKAREQKKSRCFYTSGFLYQLLPCAAGAALSAYEYLFLLDLVLCRVVDGVYLGRSDYCS